MSEKPADGPEFKRLRKSMVEQFVRARGIREPWVLRVMEKVPRHLFVDQALWGQSYGDRALPIGERQTISQPHTIALTTRALELEGGERILEIGTGSGYQTAILAEFADHVFSIEKVPALARRARKILDHLGYLNITVKILDGSNGWRQEAPYDRILVSAVASSVPASLGEQLRNGGILVMPLEEHGIQRLVRLEKTEGVWKKEILGTCRFVPLIHKPSGETA